MILNCVPSALLVSILVGAFFTTSSSEVISQYETSKLKRQSPSEKCGVQFQEGGISLSPLRRRSTLVEDATHPGQFPWLAGLYYLNSSQQWEQRCCGTLITSHIVITAAHCLLNSFENRPHPPNDLRVSLGKYYRDFYKTEPNSQISKVKEVIFPPHYRGAPSFFALDIGLLDLEESVQVTSFVMPVCIDWRTVFTLDPRAEGFVAGWGKTEQGTSSDVILSGRQKINEHDECVKNIRGALKRFITHDKFCVQRIEGHTIAAGDGGAGLTVIGKNNQHFLIGVVSTKIPEQFITLITNITYAEHSNWLEVETSRLKKSHHDL